MENIRFWTYKTTAELVRASVNRKVIDMMVADIYGTGRDWKKKM